MIELTTHSKHSQADDYFFTWRIKLRGLNPQCRYGVVLQNMSKWKTGIAVWTFSVSIPNVWNGEITLSQSADNSLSKAQPSRWRNLNCEFQYGLRQHRNGVDWSHVGLLLSTYKAIWFAKKYYSPKHCEFQYGLRQHRNGVDWSHVGLLSWTYKAIWICKKDLSPCTPSTSKIVNFNMVWDNTVTELVEVMLVFCLGHMRQFGLQKRLLTFTKHRKSLGHEENFEYVESMAWEDAFLVGRELMTPVTGLILGVVVLIPVSFDVSRWIDQRTF